MFKRSRKKIILAIMGSLILLFAVTLSVILLASYREIRQENRAMLQRYVELYYLEGETVSPASGTPADRPVQSDAPVGEPPDRTGVSAGKSPGMPDLPAGERPGTPTGDPPGRPPLDQKPDYQLATFYSVVFDEDDSVIAVDNGEKDVYSEEELTGIAGDILASGSASGRSGTLTYIVDRRPNYTLVAFMDNTVSESGLSTLLRNVLTVGGAAILIMFFLSLYLSKRIIRPLEENDQKQKQFISDASHELKTPLAVIGANAEMLSREIGGNEWLANIQYENDRMDGLIRQLLDLSRAENAEPQMEPVNFSRIVTGEELAFEMLAFEQGKTIQSDMEEGVQLTGNSTQLTQIVSILLDNAIRHAEGSEIGLTLKRQGHAAVLTVINDGEAIPPEKLTHLFDRFYRVDEARTDNGHHYGLGLSIAKAIAEKHGGSISVSCSGGKVRFTVSLPIKKR